MRNHADNDKSPAAFLVAVGDALKAQEGVDADLAAIVSKHIITAAPAEQCVFHALKEIVALATKRASPEKEEGADA